MSRVKTVWIAEGRYRRNDWYTLWTTCRPYKSAAREELEAHPSYKQLSEARIVKFTRAGDKKEAEGKSAIFVVEARLRSGSTRPWFVWSYAAHSDKKIIAEHVRSARKNFPEIDFRVAKFVYRGLTRREP